MLQIPERQPMRRDDIQWATFSGHMQALAVKSKTLRQQGMRKHPKAADALTNLEIDHLYKKQLGTSNRGQLTNFLWHNNTTHFGIGGEQEHR